MTEKTNRNIHFTHLEPTDAYHIKPLWKQLNSHHHEKSIHHKRHFATFTFEKRMNHLLEKKVTTIICAQDNGKIIAYCMISIDNAVGEIDSIFVEKSYRGKGIAAELMLRAISWLNQNSVERITVSVVYGNEDTLPFYYKFGFKERLIVLSKEE